MKVGVIVSEVGGIDGAMRALMGELAGESVLTAEGYLVQKGEDLYVVTSAGNLWGALDAGLALLKELRKRGVKVDRAAVLEEIVEVVQDAERR